MLPILKMKPAAQTGVMIKQRAPDAKPDDESSGDEGIEACAQDLIHAIHAKDTKAVASALKSLFDIIESGASEEADSKPSPHSYDAQNALAGQE